MGESESALETLRCALCENHLSVSPIVAISMNGESLKCGRCRKVQTEVNIRNTALEAILKQSIFPCIFQHCHRKLRWSEVEQHERICPQRTIPCPFFECDDVVVVEDWESHFLNRSHKYGNVANGEFTRQLFFIKYGVALLIKNRIPYVIHYGLLSEERIWISVFSLRPGVDRTIKYEVKFSSPDCETSLLYENQTIIPYNPREHCTRCIFDTFEDEKCFLPYHIFSDHGYSRSYNRESADCKTTIIDLTAVKAFFNSQPIYYTINIKDNIESLPVNNNLLRQSLQCPICLQLMPHEIHTCRVGHIFCHNCKPWLKACPTCRRRIGKTRNYALEEMAENVELVCQHRESGCNFTGNVRNIYQHETECYYSIIKEQYY